MKNIISTLFTSAVFMSMSAPALAVDSLALAKQKRCLVCHSVDKESFAPTFQSIAIKYREQKDAEAILVKQIIGGSGDHWVKKMPGPVPAGIPVRDVRTRPPVSATQATQLARWILRLGKE